MFRILVGKRNTWHRPWRVGSGQSSKSTGRTHNEPSRGSQGELSSLDTKRSSDFRHEQEDTILSLGFLVLGACA